MRVLDSGHRHKACRLLALAVGRLELDEERQDKFLDQLEQAQRDHTTEIRKMADDVRLLRQQAQEAIVVQEKNVGLLREEFIRSLKQFEDIVKSNSSAR